jgi:hypothetical protein
MNFRKTILFVFSLCLVAFVYLLFPSSELRVALKRLEPAFLADTNLEKRIRTQCDSLESYHRHLDTLNQLSEAGVPNMSLERQWIQRIYPSLAPLTEKRCFLRISYAGNEKFHLRSYWAFTIRILAPDQSLIEERTLNTSTPTRLCLMPLLLFFLFTLAGQAWAKPSLFAGLFFLFCYGFNVTQSLSAFAVSLFNTLTGDMSFLGFALFLLWFSIRAAETPTPPLPPLDKKKNDRKWNRFIRIAIALWNPVIFTVLSRVLLPLREKKKTLLAFLCLQTLFLCASTYLFSSQGNFTSLGLLHNLLLPRYFTFACFLCAIFPWLPWQNYARPILWKWPRLGRSLIWIALIEVLSFIIPGLSNLSTLTRIASGLVLGELIARTQVNLQVFLKTFLPLLTLSLLSYAMPDFLSRSGVTELLNISLDPKLHPNVLAFYCFFSGFILSAISGSFSWSVFGLLQMMKPLQLTPLMEASLIDGVLAGYLVSPFSLINIVFAQILGLKLSIVIRERLHSLQLPFLMVLIVLTVSLADAVTILRPISFIFICLVFISWQLKEKFWSLKIRSRKGDIPFSTV